MKNGRTTAPDFADWDTAIEIVEEHPLAGDDLHDPWDHAALHLDGLV